MSNIDKLLNSDNKNYNLFAKCITDLRSSQGFYSRLYYAVCEATNNEFNKLCEALDTQNFNDTLDVILWLEE